MTSNIDSSRISRQLPTAPTSHAVYNHPTNANSRSSIISHSAVHSPEVHLTASRRNPIRPLHEELLDDGSSIYPGPDAPPLPLYVKDEPSDFPPAPSYTDSHHSFINGHTGYFPQTHHYSVDIVPHSRPAESPEFLNPTYPSTIPNQQSPHATEPSPGKSSFIILLTTY